MTQIHSWHIKWLMVVISGLAIALLCLMGQVSIGRAAATAHAPTGLEDYVRWVGSQHSHTNMDADDGYAGSTAASAFAYAKNVSTLDYFIITPHVHQSRTGSATLYSDATYNTIKASAITATTVDFVAIAGQEVSTLSTGGHWNLFNASALVGTDHPDGRSEEHTSELQSQR